MVLRAFQPLSAPGIPPLWSKCPWTHSGGTSGCEGEGSWVGPVCAGALGGPPGSLLPTWSPSILCHAWDPVVKSVQGPVSDRPVLLVMVQELRASQEVSTLLFLVL